MSAGGEILLAATMAWLMTAAPLAASTSAAVSPLASPGPASDGDGVLISPRGRGDFLGIVEALAASPDAVVFRIEPGAYRESLAPARKLLLVASYAGEVVIDGDDQPAVHLSGVAQVTLRDLTLVGSRAAVRVGRGQLTLGGCVVRSRPRSVALMSDEPVSKLVVQDSLIEARAGRAFDLHPGTTSLLSRSVVTWWEDNHQALDQDRSWPPLVIDACSFGPQRVQGPRLLPDALDGLDPGAGRAPAPERRPGAHPARGRRARRGRDLHLLQRVGQLDPAHAVRAPAHGHGGVHRAGPARARHAERHPARAGAAVVAALALRAAAGVRPPGGPVPGGPRALTESEHARLARWWEVQFPRGDDGFEPGPVLKSGVSPPCPACGPW